MLQYKTKKKYSTLYFPISRLVNATLTRRTIKTYLISSFNTCETINSEIYHSSLRQSANLLQIYFLSALNERKEILVAFESTQ